MKRAAKKNAFHEVVAQLPPDSQVAILGELSRTWYMDRNRLVEVLSALEDADVDVAIIGDGPFQRAALAAIDASYSDECVWLVCGPKDPEALPFIAAAEAFFVFPSRVKKELDAVSPLMPYLLEAGVPVVALHPEGDSTIVSAEG